MIKTDFRTEIERIMSHVPAGHVVTYGDLAALAGHPTASRIVGGIAHYGNPDLPWHRLVNRFGGLAAGFPGGREAQSQLLIQEGISSTNYVVDNFKDIRWKPSHL